MTRLSHHAPIAYCLAEPRAVTRASSSITSCFYDKPFLKFERLLEAYLAFAPRGSRLVSCMAILLWLKEKLFQKCFRWRAS